MQDTDDSKCYTWQNMNIKEQIGQSPIEELDRAMRTSSRIFLRPTGNVEMRSLPASHLRLLQVIGRLPDSKMVDVAKALDVQLPAVSQMVDKMVKAGNVVRIQDPLDRRISRLRLTPEMEELLSDATSARLARVAKAVEVLSSEEVETLTMLLDRLSNQLAPRTASGFAGPAPVAREGYDADPSLEIASSRRGARVRKRTL